MLDVNISIEERYYSKNPRSSDLGKKIIIEGIIMLDELGYEDFTFKKLAIKIDSTEASVYRYFENKHKLLVYLTTWYWSWIEYMIDYKTHFLKDDLEILKEMLKIVCHSDETVEYDNAFGIDIYALRRIVLIESDKTYLTKHVDEINNQGLFKGFKSLCHKISAMILKINPDYPHANAIVSTVLEASHQQAFFALHLPSLTEISRDSKISIEQQVYDFIEDTVIRLVKP